MPPVCLFDVNETLLDLAALDPLFEHAFGSGRPARMQWFQQLLQSAFLSTLLGPYTDFGALGAAALTMLAEGRGLSVSRERSAAILQGMRSLPAHPDVPEALGRLRRGGVRLAALTNSAPEVARAQVESAGLGEYFEQVFSADEAAPQARPGALPHGSTAYGGAARPDAAGGGPRVGHDRSSARWLPRRVRRPTRAGPRPARPPSRDHRRRPG